MLILAFTRFPLFDIVPPPSSSSTRRWLFCRQPHRRLGHRQLPLYFNTTTAFDAGEFTYFTLIALLYEDYSQAMHYIVIIGIDSLALITDSLSFGTTLATIFDSKYISVKTLLQYAI